ncbi:hypothetical protein ABZZ47_22055 [Streptomyces sp. NPDC006465]|uniref:hypothetical protein n=1 Tax=Streptomyces sp. NPDC006465 TaxID=3157174 RepID=UPI0033B20E20
MLAPNDDVDQVVCAYDQDNPSNNMGFGPIATSSSMQRAITLFNDAGPLLRPAGPPADSVAYERLPSGEELIVRRVVVLDNLQRDNLFSQALIAPAGQFGAELALGLDHDDWPLGNEVTRVRLHERLDRVDGFFLARRGQQGADRLRDIGRSADHLGILCDVTASLLAEPSRRVSLTTTQVGAHPRAVLLGLVDLLTPLLPDPWFFSTLESAESRAYRVIVLRNWPHEGSPDYGRLRMGGQLAPTPTVREVAGMLVGRYQKYGLEGLDLLKGRQDWHSMHPDQRIQALWSTLAVASGMTPHKALPPGTPRGTTAAEPGMSGVGEDTGRPTDGGAEDRAALTEPARGHSLGMSASLVGQPSGPGRAAGQEDGAPERTEDGDGPHHRAASLRTSGGSASSAASPTDGDKVGMPGGLRNPPAPTTPPLTRGFTHPPVAKQLSGADREARIRRVTTLVERVFGAQTLPELQSLVDDIGRRADGWTDEEADAAAVTAIHCRLGLPKQRGRTGRKRSAAGRHLPYFFDLLVRRALSRQPAAFAWAAFLHQEAAATFSEPLRSVVERMYAEQEQGELVLHQVFFVALGKRALLDGLSKKSATARRTPGRLPLRPGRPPAAHGKCGNHAWPARAPRPTRADGPPDGTSGRADIRAGLTEDLLRLGKALFGVLLLLSAGTALLVWLVLSLGLL